MVNVVHLTNQFQGGPFALRLFSEESIILPSPSVELAPNHAMRSASSLKLNIEHLVYALMPH